MMAHELGYKKYFLFYNAERQHQSLDYRTSQEACEGRETRDVRPLKIEFSSRTSA